MLRYIADISTVIIGSLIVAIGILFFLESGHGADPLSTFLLGIINYIAVSIGLASQIFNLGILAIMFIINKRLLGVGSLLNAFFVGFFINICEQPLSFVAAYIPIIVQVLIGPLLLGIGTGIYLSARLGSGAIESFMLYLVEKIKISIKVSRMLLDGFFVISGIALGGTWGIGSVLGIALIGPIAEVTLRLIERLTRSHTHGKS